MEGYWCDSINSIINGIQTGDQDLPRLFFDYNATIFRVLATMLEHSLLIKY